MATKECDPMQAKGLKLAAYIDKYLALWDFYGVIQVIEKGEVLFENAYGYASIEFEIRNQMNSCFSLASISKQFTAFAILLLHEKQVLDIDQGAHLYLPAELKIDESITVHHLLSHTSGLANFYNFEGDFFADYNRKDYSRSDFFLMYFRNELAYPPGTTFNYNNANYNLLAWMIEHVSGEKYEDYVRNHIFLPLGMTNSVVDDGSKLIKNKSSNYVQDCDAFIKSPYHNEKFSVGAGAIASNCDNLYKWYICLRDRKILSPRSYARLFEENHNNYCYGLEHHVVYGTNTYTHGGDHLGVSTYMQNYFDEDICIIILSNNTAIDQYRLGKAISDILHHVDVDVPAKLEEYPIDNSKLQDYCGVYLKDKIEVKCMNGKLYFVRFKANLHIEVYPVGKDSFARRYSDTTQPYRITQNEKGERTFFGFAKRNVEL
ncbi:serine hydrolase domain-containing protein [Paenibacillus qinlingensis]|uniref:CubicO group peptidase (Beta-lactamase class C family) n=1 Tax=Paenibacillus qinlingensis TaxID=1837343 RepID=A0ABU1NRW5_9BACL|nr:serine hydrolase domain-containing protein [Paenibacillus qinlingensis]MDR6550168.1 CubicO group peptidase (beta-lactamase class C family) [Paenibacillus qinlingensis]